ncbi:MAG: ABC transporter permease subunit [Pseudomonadota bacterium]
MVERSRFKTVAVAVVSSWILLFVLVPNLLVTSVSVLTRDDSRLVRLALTLENYRLLMDPVVLAMFMRSLGYAAVTTAACLFIGYPFAFIIARSPLKHVLLVLIIIPFWTSSLVRTYALIIILKANGLVNTILLALGIIDAPLTILYTNTAVLIGLIYMLLPFMILPLYATVEKLDMNLVEAGQDLGASWLQVMRYVVLPVTMPGIIAGVIMVFLPTLGLFYVPDLLGGAKSMLVGNFIKNQFLVTRHWPLGAAASVFLTLILLVLFAVYYLNLRRFGHQPGELSQ